MQLGQRGPKADAPEYARARYLLSNLGLSVRASQLLCILLSWHPLLLDYICVHAVGSRTLRHHVQHFNAWHEVFLRCWRCPNAYCCILLRWTSPALYTYPAYHQNDLHDAESLHGSVQSGSRGTVQTEHQQALLVVGETLSLHAAFKAVAADMTWH